jgi:hypothetical protein
MHWILQENIFKEAAYEKLLETLERFGLPHSVHKVVPFVGELMPTPELDHKNVICMGSYSMRHYSKQRVWTPGVFDLEPCTFEVQLEHWGNHMLNYLSRVWEFKDAKFPWFSVCSGHGQLTQPGETDCPRCNTGSYGEFAFIRPIADSKVFAGRVFEKAEFEEWQKKVCVLEEDDGSSLRGSTLVQVTKPLKIWAEYRFWVVMGEIVTASLYKRGDQVIYSSQVDECYFDYVRDRIAEWCPHAAFVIDVADTPKGIKIVEINTLNSSGFLRSGYSEAGHGT